MACTARISALFILLVLCPVPLAAQSDGEADKRFVIDSQRSILRVYVRRAGLLGGLGHNHVIHTRELSGQIILATRRENSTASFTFPVASLVVDDSAERERAGSGFESQPDESAIADTRENMLGEAVLNADVFDSIAVTVTPVSSETSQWLLAAEVEFQNNDFILQIPAQIEVAGDEVAVSANFTLNHADLGLSPFRALAGTLRVARAIDFELDILALRAEATEN